MTERDQERDAVVAWLRACANVHESIAPDVANAAGIDAGFYNADASIRYRAIADAIERGEHLPTGSEARTSRVQKYLGDESAARKRLATFPTTVRQRLHDWQEGQGEWFSDTLLEIVSEFITYDDNARSDELANKAGGLWYRRWFVAQNLVNELEAKLAEV